MQQLETRGLSYHNIESSREIECNQHAVNMIEKVFQDENIPYIKAKTWTTAAFFAVARFRNVALGQILFRGGRFKRR